MQVRKSAPHTSSFTHKCPLFPNFPCVLGFFQDQNTCWERLKYGLVLQFHTLSHLPIYRTEGSIIFFLTIIIRSPKTLCHCFGSFLSDAILQIKQSSNSCLSWIVFLKLSSLFRCGTKPSVFLIALKITPLFHIIISYQVFCKCFLLKDMYPAKLDACQYSLNYSFPSHQPI